MTLSPKQIISKAISKQMSLDETQLAFSSIMNGEFTEAQIAGLLVAISTRGESIEEIAGAAQAMRKACNRIKAPRKSIDIVGTGGDGKGTLNISTASAIVVAGCGVTVAKHGNRNLSSLSGAADILTECGVNIKISPASVENCISEIGIGFMMAPVHHPAMRHVMPTRQALGIRTIFNILGPLTNPANVKYQLSGAYDKNLLKPMAETLKLLGTSRAWLVHGDDGTDELSICGPSKVVELNNGKIREFKIHPEDCGLEVQRFSSILGGSPEHNKNSLLDLLKGKKSAYRDSVLLNSAAALVISGVAKSLSIGVETAIKSIDSGAAKRKLDELIRYTTRDPND